MPPRSPRLADEFPDEKLFVDVHGFTPGSQPAQPGEVLRMLLGALGVASGRIPDGLEERAALWRAELAPRQALVVLDNAA
jgi:hypothetical protein